PGVSAHVPYGERRRRALCRRSAPTRSPLHLQRLRGHPSRHSEPLWTVHSALAPAFPTAMMMMMARRAAGYGGCCRGSPRRWRLHADRAHEPQWMDSARSSVYPTALIADRHALVVVARRMAGRSSPGSWVNAKKGAPDATPLAFPVAAAV